VLYAAKEGDCRACPLAPQCLGRGGSGEHPRRVSGTRTLLGYQVRPLQAPWPALAPGEHTTGDVLARGNVLWGDLPSRRIRRGFFQLLRQQRVTLVPPPAVVDAGAAGREPRRWTRAERAHRRVSWAARLARNALATESARYTITLWGIPPQLATHLDLPALEAA
jgi:hypothetical protein